VALEGSGAATVVKAGPSFLSTPAPSGGYPVLTTAGAVNATIAHLTVDQSGDTLDGRVPDRLSGYLVEIRRSTNAMVDDVHTRNPFTYSIAVAGSSRFCVRRSSTLVTSSGRYDQLDGIHVLDSSDGQIIDNVVDQRGGNDGDDGLVAHSLGAPVRNVTYAGNKVRGGTHGGGLQIAAGDEPIQGLVIKDNEFWGSPFGIRTGQYDHGRGSIHDITIEGNNIHDLVTGSSISGFGNAVEITDSGASLPGKIWNVVLRFNRTCRAGSVVLPRTSGNLVSRPRGC